MMRSIKVENNAVTATYMVTGNQGEITSPFLPQEIPANDGTYLHVDDVLELLETVAREHLSKGDATPEGHDHCVAAAELHEVRTRLTQAGV